MDAVYNLVIGLAGSIGSGCTTLADRLKEVVDDWPACVAVPIKVADIIGSTGLGGKILGLEAATTTRPDGRRRSLQGAGTRLRCIDPELVAKLIVSKVHEHGNGIEKATPESPPATVVFIVDSLKNRNDVVGLRRIFRDEFVFIYNSLDRETRWHRSKSHQGWTEDQRSTFAELDAKDWNEQSRDPSVERAGQETGELAQFADYFVVNNRNLTDLKDTARRIFDLLMGGVENSRPTDDERRMHLAFSESIASGCLSRQVGAALFNNAGDVIGLGHNDVPKPGGGVYCVEDGANDYRCSVIGNAGCRNETVKKDRFGALTQRVVELVEAKVAERWKDPSGLKLLRDEIRAAVSSSALRSTTEYCRAVHAEMSALLSAARSGPTSTKHSQMYVTTFPCHNCAKHLLCAGVDRVVYVEPYPKSLAADLHQDGLNIDSADETSLKTNLIQYQGVAPRRYHDFFIQEGARKDKDGKAITRTRDQRAREPRFSTRVRPRKRGELTEATDPISYDEVRASVDVSDRLPAANQTQGGEPFRRSKD
jgi:deoxycytidylate deaminase